MRRLFIVATLPFLAGLTPVDDELFPSSGRETVGWMWVCGGGPPISLAEWFREADSIVRVRIDSKNAYDDPYSDSRTILTDLEVTVLDVFKLHPRGVGAGATMTITHLGGTIWRADGPDTLIVNGFPPPPVGTEWFMFLAWHDQRQQFQIDYLDDGALQVIDGGLVRPRGSREQLPAPDADAFAEALRRGGIMSPSSAGGTAIAEAVPTSNAPEGREAAR